jgi:hypothetical protein
MESEEYMNRKQQEAEVMLVYSSSLSLAHAYTKITEVIEEAGKQE